MYSNRYIFIYASVMVIVVAAILSTAANLLKPFQEKNIRVEKIQNILSSADIPSTRSDAETLFDKHIVEERAVDLEGNIVSVYRGHEAIKGSVRPFELNLKKELKKKADGESPSFPLYVCEIKGETFYIIPLLGKGLWGPIYGNIALKNDLNTIAGANFGHDKETPGLGAEIDTRDFQKRFIGKTIFDENGEFASVTVVKGGVENSNIDPRHGVDAISGGTITSNGVTEMLEDCLKNYVPYIKNVNNL